MNEQFLTGARHGRQQGPKRPVVQKRARWFTVNAPNPYASYGRKTATPMPGRGVSGESTN